MDYEIIAGVVVTRGTTKGLAGVGYEEIRDPVDGTLMAQFLDGKMVFDTPHSQRVPPLKEEGTFIFAQAA